tara:strand:- start:1701 stop:2324 length:624 start_codon:yes stop_codon:yes gene_type:complete
LQIGIIDYGCGNIHSIINAFSLFTQNVQIISQPHQIKSCDKIVLPGVGSFPRGINKLKEKNMIDDLTYFNELNKPILGICLGMQLFFEKGFEFGETLGLSFLSGNVEKLEKSLSCKLPNIGWNEVVFQDLNLKKNLLLEGIHPSDEFYFVHSYKCSCIDEKNIVAKTKYCNSYFVSIVQKDNIFGVQFHPEKSGKTGLKLISNFIAI